MKLELIKKARLDGKDIKPGDTVDIDKKLALVWIDRNIARIHVPGKAVHIPPPPVPPKGRIITEGQDPRKQNNFSKMGRKELIRLAEVMGIEMPGLKKAKKNDIIALLKECENSPNKEGSEDHDEGPEKENKEAGNGDEETD